MHQFILTADPASSSHVMTPGNREVVLVSFWCFFTTSGAVGVRRLELDLRDDISALVAELGQPATAGQTDTLNRTYAWGGSADDGTGGANIPFRLGMGEVGVPANWDLRLHDQATISAGDRVRMVALFRAL